MHLNQINRSFTGYLRLPLPPHSSPVKAKPGLMLEQCSPNKWSSPQLQNMELKCGVISLRKCSIPHCTKCLGVLREADQLLLHLPEPGWLSHNVTNQSSSLESLQVIPSAEWSQNPTTLSKTFPTSLKLLFIHFHPYLLSLPVSPLLSLLLSPFPTSPPPENTLTQYLWSCHCFFSFHLHPLCPTYSATHQLWTLASLFLHTVARKGSPLQLRFWLTIIRMGNNCHWLKMTSMSHLATPSEQLEARFKLSPSAICSTFGHRHFTLTNHWELFVRLKLMDLVFFSSRGLTRMCC